MFCFLSNQVVKEFYPGVSIASYPARLAALNLDLAIVLLELNDFNECKCNLRIMENGVLGYTNVAADFPPVKAVFR